MGVAIFLWILFVGWIMWSSKDAKETFLFYAWVTMLLLGLGPYVFMAIAGVFK